jgi:hypothetical protein
MVADSKCLALESGSRPYDAPLERIK